MSQISRIMAIIVFLPVFGAFGFWLIEHLRPIDAFYMSFITLSTVGYEVVKPLSDNGKLFVIIYLVVGFATFFYSLSQLGEMLVKGDLKRLIKRRIMDNQIRSITDHAIICGFGRMGQSIALELSRKGWKFVVVEIDQERAELAVAEGWSCIKGDASDDSVLNAAGITKAKCLTAVLPHDPDNLFCVMAARLLNNRITIIARSNAEGSVNKLKRAGATRIVSPYATGAVKISQLMVHPELEDFMEIFIDKNSGVDLTIAEVGVDSPFHGRRLKEIETDHLGIMVIGLRRHGHPVEIPPDKTHVLDTKDALIIIGKISRLAEVPKLG